MYKVIIQGGLGNQIFQYAFAKKLKHLNREVSLDITGVEIYKYHGGFTLKNFKIDSEIRIIKWTKNRIIYRIWMVLKKYLVFYKIVKDDYNYNEEIYMLEKKKIIFDGFWADERYFKDIRDSLLVDFNIESKLDVQNESILKDVRGTNSISLHVRRGDYINIRENNSFFGICEISYYINAINYISSKLENPHFYIFSNDINWCLENLKIEADKSFININNSDKDSYKDLVLMKNCKHNIIANSTFSWWGAWLNENEEKIVIAPQKWYADEYMQSKYETSNFIPKEWIKL